MDSYFNGYYTLSLNVVKFKKLHKNLNLIKDPTFKPLNSIPLNPVQFHQFLRQYTFYLILFLLKTLLYLKYLSKYKACLKYRCKWYLRSFTR